MKHTTNTENHTGKYEDYVEDYEAYITSYSCDSEENDLYTVKRKTTFSFAEVVELLKSKKEKKHDT
jgi:hypothetical protein